MMADIDQLVGRAQKAMYRNVVEVVDEEIQVMTLDVAARRVAREAGHSAAATAVLQRLQTTDREYNAPSLHSPIDVSVLDKRRKQMSAAILAAGPHARIVRNHEARMYFPGLPFRSEGFDSCVQAWITEAVTYGVRAEQIGRPTHAYEDEAAKEHACMMGTVRIVGNNQILVVVATNYYGRYHVVQVRAMSEENGGVESKCFDPVAA